MARRRRSSGSDRSSARPGGPLGRARYAVGRGLRGLRDLADIRLDPTYRRLAADYGSPTDRARVYCHHIRKTAGTSLFLSFLALGGEDPMEVWRRINSSRLPRTVSGRYAFVSVHRRLLAEGAYFYGRAHRPVEEQPLPPGTFTVTVLRDPVARVHSYFDYLVAGDEPGRARSGGRHASGAWPTPASTRSWTGSRRTPSAEPADTRSRPASTCRRRPIGSPACSAVFFTEHYADGLAALGRQARPPPGRAPGPGDRRPGRYSVPGRSPSGCGRCSSRSTTCWGAWRRGASATGDRRPRRDRRSRARGSDQHVAGPQASRRTRTQQPIPRVTTV